MKIVHLIWAFPIGGAETMLVEIINLQHLRGKITLIIINNLYNEELISQINKDVRVVRINRPPKSKNVLYLLKTWLIIFFSRPHIVHCHNASLCKLLVGLKKKSCLTVHNVNSINSSQYFKYFNRIYAISEAVKKFVFQETSLHANLVYNGISTKDVKVKNNYDFEIFKIVQISRLEHNNKGQDILIMALKHLIFEIKISNVQLDFIGTGSSFDYLKELVLFHNLENYINFEGEIDKKSLYHMICKYNLVVQPSINEGFGLTVVEGMTAKVPVLISNIDGPLEIIKNGLYGSYFKSGDAMDCALKLKEIINNYSHYTSEDKLHIIRNYAISNFDISKTASNYLRAYVN